MTELFQRGPVERHAREDKQTSAKLPLGCSEIQLSQKFNFFRNYIDGTHQQVSMKDPKGF